MYLSISVESFSTFLASSSAFNRSLCLALRFSTTLVTLLVLMGLKFQGKNLFFLRCGLITIACRLEIEKAMKEII